MHNSTDDDDAFDLEANLATDTKTKSEQSVLDILGQLQQARWFLAPPSKATTVPNSPTDFHVPDISSRIIKELESSIDAQEKQAIAKRRNAQDPAHANSPTLASVPETITSPTRPIIASVAPTMAPHSSVQALPATCESPIELVKCIGREHSLNAEQMIEVFNEVATRVPEEQSKVPQLKMTMTGPSGTGKTHVIRALTALMALYGCAHRIRYLAQQAALLC